MSHLFRVFVVDDDPMLLDVMQSILSPECDVTIFASAEECQMALTLEMPDMFLLDVNLPGIDGYALCRWIKADDRLRRIPVTFVSSYDTIDARLAGYDAGGEDFIVKPFEPDEVLRKVGVAQQIVQNQRSLEEQIEASEYLSSLVMAGMDEAGILLQFMSKLIAWDRMQDIGSGLLELMKRYRLDGVVQTRTTQHTATYSAAGVDLPLEVSIINHVRELGRIFEFHNRSVHNFERVTLMIQNLPLDQPEYCGRLRDNLSTAAQNADARLKAIETSEANLRSQAGIQQALEGLSSTLLFLRTAETRDHAESVALISELNEKLIEAFLTLGLTERQEGYLQNLIGDFSGRMSALLDQGEETQRILVGLGDELASLRQS
jgi:CheY-like chemotaxis protein